jgi:hypothetical protein
MRMTRQHEPQRAIEHRRALDIRRAKNNEIQAWRSSGHVRNHRDSYAWADESGQP